MAEVTFRIDLEDANDEVPIFYGIDPVTVPENSEPGTHVAVATAIDKDGTPPNNQVCAALGRDGRIATAGGRRKRTMRVFSVHSSIKSVPLSWAIVIKLLLLYSISIILYIVYFYYIYYIVYQKIKLLLFMR